MPRCKQCGKAPPSGVTQCNGCGAVLCDKCTAKHSCSG